MDRAYSRFEIRSTNEEQRIIEGVASTPSTDRMGDIVDPHGAIYKLPLPFLWQHDKNKPIGHVLSAKVTDEGIVVQVKIERGVLPFIEEAWQLIKSRLVRGLSIGFRAIQSANTDSGGLHFKFWEWLELSAVTIPANQNASIAVIKALDDWHLRGSPRNQVPVLPAQKAAPARVMPRLSEVVEVPEKLRGVGLVRYLQAIIRSGGDHLTAIAYAEANPRWRDTPGVVTALKAAVTAGSTTDSDWAQPLSTAQLGLEFIELVKPMTVLGIIGADARHVPLNTRIARQTQASTVYWVGEGAMKQASELKFDDLVLRPTKIAGFVVITSELGKMARPSAEQLIKQDLSEAIGQFSDQSFLDPAATGVVGVQPASITAGTTPIVGTGDILVDAQAAIAQIAAAGSELRAPYWVGRPGVISALASAQSSLVPGRFLNFPVVTSSSAPASTLTLIDAGEVVLADDGGVDVAVSTEATLDLGDGVPKALWQHDLVAIRCERFINWVSAHGNDAAAAYISGVTDLAVRR